MWKYNRLERYCLIKGKCFLEVKEKGKIEINGSSIFEYTVGLSNGILRLSTCAYTQIDRKTSARAIKARVDIVRAEEKKPETS